MAGAFEVSRLVCYGFQLAVEHKLVLTDSYAFAFQCVYTGCRGSLIGNLHLIGALEVAT